MELRRPPHFQTVCETAVRHRARRPWVATGFVEPPIRQPLDAFPASARP